MGSWEYSPPRVSSQIPVARPVSTAPPGGAAPQVDLNEAKGEYGNVIPISMGTRRMSPQLIWAKPIYGDGTNWFADFAVSWGYNGDATPADTEINKLFANGTLIWENGTNIMPGSWAVTLYTGTETQTSDPTIVAHLGADNVPGYRNQLYGVFVGFPIGAQFGYAIPGISAEISGEVAAIWADVGDGLTLSNGDLTLTSNSGDVDAAITNMTHPVTGTEFDDDVYQFEVTLDAMPDPAEFVFGIVGEGYNVEDDPTTSPLAVVITGNADVYTGGAYDFNGGWDFLAGDVIQVFVQRAIDRTQFRRVRGGAPATYITVNHFSLLVGADVHAIVALGGGGNVATVNFEEPWAATTVAYAQEWGSSGTGGPISTTLPATLERVAEYAHLDPDTDLDIDPAIDDEVAGLVLGADTNYGEFAQNAGQWFGFDFFESEDIRLIRPVDGATYSVDKVIPAADLLNEGAQAITTTRGEDDSPLQISGQYIDQTQQFRFNTQRARRILFPTPSTTSRRRLDIAVPYVLTANQAMTYLGQAIYRMAAQNVVHHFTLGPKHLDIEPGDILTITAGDTAYTVKVTRVEIQADLRISLHAVNLYANEDMALVGESGDPLGDFAGEAELLTLSFTAEAGSYLIAGEDAAFTAGILIVTDTGSYAVTGGTAAFLAPILTAETGTYTISGQDAAFLVALTLTAETGSYAITGQSAGFSLDPHAASVGLLLGFDGANGATTTTDESPAGFTGHTITFNGNAQISTSSPLVGTGSLLLDGTGDYIEIANHTEFEFSNGDFTVELSVKWAGTGGQDGLIGIWEGGANNRRSWMMRYDGTSTGFLDFFMSSNGSTSTNVIHYAWSPSVGTQYNLCVERDVTDKVRLYIDGTMVASATSSIDCYDHVSPLLIGTYDQASPSSNVFNGRIDEVRITKGVARYASDGGYTVSLPHPRS